MKAGKHEIPRRPLLWLAAGMAFTVPPVFKSIALWIPICFLSLLAAKFWMERRGWHPRSLALRLAFAGAAVGAVRLTYGSLFGLESGLSVLLMLAAVKILESHTARDFHVMAALGWLLCLTGLFISQDLLAGIYGAVAFTLVLAAVVQFHRGSGSGRPVWGPMRTSIGLVLQSLPIVIALFFLFPRGSTIRFDLRHTPENRTGMSNDLRPGSISSLALSTDVAFRVEFPDGNMPAYSNLYWRATVLTQDHGLTWNTSPLDEIPRHSNAPEHLGGGPIRQHIILQPHEGRWVFALEWPMEFPRGTRMYRGNVLRSDKTIYSQWQYEVTSFPTNREEELDPAERNNCLQIPGRVSPQIFALVESWKEKSGDPHAIIASALQFFHKEKFFYTLTPGQYDDKSGLDDFLFRRRSGFCEHYAAAFATLMRVAGIPSRVVIGYQGGQFNSIGKYLVIHQSDAHAWCEVWLPGVGWEREDPTAAVATARVGMVDMRDTSGAVMAEDAGGQFAGAWDRQPILRNIRLAWEAISYEWDSRVANFDEETQQSFFLGMGWLDTHPLRLLAWLSVAVVALLAMQALVTGWKTRVALDPLKAAYENFCRKVAALGVKREPWEGPARFAERAAALLPAHAAHIRRVADIYISLRYRPGPGAGILARAIKAFRREARA